MLARTALSRLSIALSRLLISRFPIHLHFPLSSNACRTMASNSNGEPAMAKHEVEKEAHHLANGKVEVNNWSQPGPAAFDFRSKQASHRAALDHLR